MRTLSAFTFALLLPFALHAEVILVTDSTNNKVVRVGSSGSVTDFQSTGMDGPRGVVVDADRNLYVANFTSGTIVKYPPGGGPSTYATGLSGPTGMVMDEDGILYVAESTANPPRISSVASAMATPGLVANLLTGDNPQGLAIQEDGTIYVANQGNSTVARIPQGGQKENLPLDNGDVTAPRGIAVDPSDVNTIYCVENGGQLKSIAKRGQNNYQVRQVGNTTFNGPVALGVDEHGIFYILCTGSNSIERVAANGGDMAPLATNSGLANAGGMAVIGASKTILVSKGDAIDAPNTPTISVLGLPAISDVGGAAYKATLAIGNGVTTANAGCILQNTPNIEVIARAGNLSPNAMGTDNTDGTFYGLFSDPLINSTGDVGFRATLKLGSATAGKNTALFSNVSGSMREVARQGIPDITGFKYTAFTTFAMANNNLIFQANVAGPGITSVNNSGIWNDQGTELFRKNKDLTVNSVPLKVKSFVFLKALPFQLGALRAVAPDGSLGILANVSDGTHAAVSVVNGNSTAFAHKNGMVSNPANTKFAKINPPAVASGGDLAYKATLAAVLPGAVTSASAAAIFVDEGGGTRTKIAQANFTAPDASGATASIANGLFGALSDPMINGNSEVAFYATLKGVASGTTNGVWSNVGGTLKRVARQGEQPSGLVAGTKFVAFKSLALPHEGGLVIMAVVSGTGISSANNLGIWQVDSDGTLQLIVRKGDKLDVNDSLRTVTGLKLLSVLPYGTGMGRNYSPNGTLAVHLTFSDGTTSILQSTLP